MPGEFCRPQLPNPEDEKAGGVDGTPQRVNDGSPRSHEWSTAHATYRSSLFWFGLVTWIVFVQNRKGSNRLSRTLLSLSLVFFLVVFVILIRGFFATDSIGLQILSSKEARWYSVTFGGGSIWFEDRQLVGPRLSFSGKDSRFWSRLSEPPWRPSGVPIYGTSQISDRLHGMATARFFRIPHWFLLCLTLLYPLKRGISRWVHKRRIAIGRANCAFCGYDLRATPDRCPECGRLTH